MDEIEHLATSTDPLLRCCLCRGLLRVAMQLSCLHNCCRQCFSEAASKVGSHIVGCGICGAITQTGSEQPNGFIDCQVQRFVSMTGSRACDVCKGNGEHGQPALVWCPACRYSLCEDCTAAHRQYNRQHVTQSLEELKSVDEVCWHPSAAACATHGKPLEIACLNCEQVKCTSCWASCKEKEHEVHIVGEDSFNSYVGTLIASLSTMESELLQKSEVLNKPKSVLLDARAARDRHLEDLNQRKRRVVDAVEIAYQKMALSTKDAYDNLEAEGGTAAAAAERIASDLSDARSYINRLVESNDKCQIFKQQKIVRDRLSVLSAELNSLSDRLTTTMAQVKIETSLPEDVEDVVRAWIGIPQMYKASTSPHAPQQQQQQCLTFSAASSSIQLPVLCWNVALTTDGRSLLLAAVQHGLIEISLCDRSPNSSTKTRELSHWLPPRCSSGLNDRVLAVAALSNRRAAVSLRFAQSVILLRRSDEIAISEGAAAASAVHDAWTEDCRLDQLPWPARWLSAHCGVLAASEFRLDEKQSGLCGPGSRLQIMSLSSRLRLNVGVQREYDIRGLAVTDSTIITGSWGRVTLGGGRLPAHVLDAHSVADDGNDKRLWRHVLDRSDNEWLFGICADSIGGYLYAAVCRSDWSCGYVSSLSLADGCELRRIALCIRSPSAFQQLHQPAEVLPVQLSLSNAKESSENVQPQQHSIGRRKLLLAALCCDPKTKQQGQVTLHRVISDELQ